jgi:hypothetical protein
MSFDDYARVPVLLQQAGIAGESFPGIHTENMESKSK